MSTRVAIYTRVSTHDDRQTARNQDIDLVKFIHDRDWTLKRRFKDEASGSKDARPGLAALMEAVSRREVDVVLVWKLDRLTRRGASHALSLIQHFESCGVHFHSYTEPMFQTTGPMRDILISIASAIAQYEAGLISERSRAGIRRAKAQGIHCGRPRKLAIRLQIPNLRREGQTLTAIANLTGCSVSTVCRILNEEKKTNGTE